MSVPESLSISLRAKASPFNGLWVMIKSSPLPLWLHLFQVSFQVCSHTEHPAVSRTCYVCSGAFSGNVSSAWTMAPQPSPPIIHLACSFPSCRPFSKMSAHWGVPSHPLPLPLFNPTLVTLSPASFFSKPLSAVQPIDFTSVVFCISSPLQVNAMWAQICTCFPYSCAWNNCWYIVATE